MEAKTLWKATQGELEILLSPMVFNAWIKTSHIKELTEESVTILCKNEYAQKNLEKFRSSIEDSINKIAGKELELKVEIGATQEKPEKKDLGPLFQPVQQNGRDLTKESSKAGLSPRFNFANYVMGTHNRLAYAIAQSIAENPGQQHNPFFLYSGVGLGKTHLLHAIGNGIIEKHPTLKVIYTTGEDFMNELIQAIRGGSRNYNPAKFRQKYRNVDVFLIDDIQFIAGTKSTQEEFFHTFNTLFMAQKQIVIASDRHPRAFNNLEDRITSRFSSGIISDISSPDIDMRIAILQEKREVQKNTISDEVIKFVAETIDTNIRELEGAYMQVITESMKDGQDPSIESAAKALGQVIERQQSKNINVNEILKAVANYYSVKIGDIKGKRRTKEIVIPRQIAMYLMHEITGTAYMTIGELLGGRDHTTVMHGCRKVEDGMGDPQKVKQDLINIRQALYE